jgi:hypothetical protein
VLLHACKYKVPFFAVDFGKHLIVEKVYQEHNLNGINIAAIMHIPEM